MNVFKCPLSQPFTSWDNKSISYMSTCHTNVLNSIYTAVSPAWWENTRTLCGYMYVDVRRRGKVQGRSMLSQGSVARATVRELLVVVIHVTCSLMRKLTEGRGGEGRGTRGERCCRNGRSHCSGELISSRGPLFILEGSMEPHCP